ADTGFGADAAGSAQNAAASAATRMTFFIAKPLPLGLVCSLVVPPRTASKRASAQRLEQRVGALPQRVGEPRAAFERLAATEERREPPCFGFVDRHRRFDAPDAPDAEPHVARRCQITG